MVWRNCLYGKFPYGKVPDKTYDSREKLWQRFSLFDCFLWPPYEIGQAIIFLPCGFCLSSLYLFPRLISAVGDWMSTIHPHMVWP